jgi:hypothetical protein
LNILEIAESVELTRENPLIVRPVSNGRNARGISWSERDGDASEHELGGETMSVKSSFAGKRKLAAMRQDQPDALKPSLKAVAGRRPRTAVFV